MYYKKFLDFLKNHGLYDEKIFKYWFDNRDTYDYRDEDARDFTSVYYENIGGYLNRMHIFVPHIDSDITVAINIHEYVHLFLMYKYLGKKCKICRDCEVLPIFFEMVFLEENQSTELINYYINAIDTIKKSADEKYLLALKLSSDLLNSYKKQEVNKLDSKVKRLVLKHDIKKAFNI